MVDFLLDVVWPFILDVALPIIMALFGMVLLFMAVIGIVSKLSAQSFQNEVEAVRSAIVSLGCNASEDVMGAGVDINRRIVRAHYWNGTVFAFITPNEIADAEPIRIPECGK